MGHMRCAAHDPSKRWPSLAGQSCWPTADMSVQPRTRLVATVACMSLPPWGGMGLRAAPQHFGKPDRDRRHGGTLGCHMCHAAASAPHSRALPRASLARPCPFPAPRLLVPGLSETQHDSFVNKTHAGGGLNPATNAATNSATNSATNLATHEKCGHLSAHNQRVV